MADRVKTEAESRDACAQCPMTSGGSVGGYDVVSAPAELRALLEEIFTDRFMSAHTNFQNFESFRYSSAVIVNWEADVMIYARDRLDAFVRESTRFSSWDEMVKQAADARYLTA